MPALAMPPRTAPCPTGDLWPASTGRCNGTAVYVHVKTCDSVSKAFLVADPECRLPVDGSAWALAIWTIGSHRFQRKRSFHLRLHTHWIPTGLSCCQDLRLGQVERTWPISTMKQYPVRLPMT